VVSEPFLERPTARVLVERFEDRAVVVSEATFAGLAALPAGVGMLAVVPTPAAPAPAHDDFCLLLDGVQDPGNVGSILRSAAAAGVALVCLSRDCAFAWSPKVLRAGMGAHFALAISEDVDLAGWSDAYRLRGHQVVATVREGGVSVYRAALERPLAVAIGNEGAGLSAAMLASASARVSIPMPGRAESLNAAAAAAVVLFECVRRNLKASG
jgi:TrmH family RNA methyltransferase